MLGVSVIVFREVLEAALIIGLVLAITRGVPGRTRLAIAGAILGVLGAIVVGLLTDRIIDMAQGFGPDLLKAFILIAAVLMLSWHLIWMRRHAQALTHNIKQVGNSILAGEKPAIVIAIIVGLALLREGSEVALFLYTKLFSERAADIALGGAMGLLAGTVVGVVMYLGLARIPLSTLFRVSGWLVLLITAGLAAQASAALAQANMVPAALSSNLWDTSWLLPEKSVLGQFLHILVGYVSNPMGIQVIVYVATIVIVGFLGYLASNIKNETSSPGVQPATTQ